MFLGISKVGITWNSCHPPPSLPFGDPNLSLAVSDASGAMNRSQTSKFLCLNAAISLVGPNDSENQGHWDSRVETGVEGLPQAQPHMKCSSKAFHLLHILLHILEEELDDWLITSFLSRHCLENDSEDDWLLLVLTLHLGGHRFVWDH